MLEAIGGITLFVLGLYLYLNYEENKTRKQELYNRLVKHAPELERKLAMAKTDEEYYRLKNEYFSITENLKKALENEEKNKLLVKEREDKHKKENILNRQYAYEFEEVIFDIFINNDVVVEDRLIKEIKKRLNVDDKEAISLLKKWESRDIIKKYYFSKINAYELGFTLLHPTVLIISKNDLTLDEWRRKNNFVEKEAENNTLDDTEVKGILDYYNKFTKSQESNFSLIKGELSEERKWEFVSAVMLAEYEILSINKVVVVNKNNIKSMRIDYVDNTSEFFPVLFTSELKINDLVDLQTIRKVTLNYIPYNLNKVYIDGEIINT